MLVIHSNRILINLPNKYILNSELNGFWEITKNNKYFYGIVQDIENNA